VRRRRWEEEVVEWRPVLLVEVCSSGRKSGRNEEGLSVEAGDGVVEVMVVMVEVMMEAWRLVPSVRGAKPIPPPRCTLGYMQTLPFCILCLWFLLHRVPFRSWICGSVACIPLLLRSFGHLRTGWITGFPAWCLL